MICLGDWCLYYFIVMIRVRQFLKGLDMLDCYEEFGFCGVFDFMSWV